MSIDEVMKIAAVFGPDSLRAAIEQHVAEAVAKAREGCRQIAFDMAPTDEHAVDVSQAIRARAEKETT